MEQNYFTASMPLTTPKYSPKTCGCPEAFTSTTISKKCSAKSNSGGQERYSQKPNAELYSFTQQHMLHKRVAQVLNGHTPSKNAFDTRVNIQTLSHRQRSKRPKEHGGCHQFNGDSATAVQETRPARGPPSDQWRFGHSGVLVDPRKEQSRVGGFLQVKVCECLVSGGSGQKPA